MAVDKSVALNPGAGGSIVRTLEVTLLQGDGSIATVEMQVLAIADRQGNVLNFGAMEGLLERLNDNVEELLFEVRLQNETNDE